LTVTLPEPPFDVPPKPKELTAAAPSRVLAVKKIDGSLMADEGDYVDPIEDGGVPMGKRKDWVTPEPDAGWQDVG